MLAGVVPAVAFRHHVDLEAVHDALDLTSVSGLVMLVYFLGEVGQDCIAV